MKQPKKFDEVINGNNNFENFRNSVYGYKVVDKFSEIFPNLIKVAKAKKFENGILFIQTDNSVWRSELNLNKEAMIKKINNYLNNEVIKNIKFL